MTISVQSDSCTQCGICTRVCPMGIILPPDEVTIPKIARENESICINCGQCEAFCPSGALVVDLWQEHILEKAWSGEDITPSHLSWYLKSRRSIRQFKPEPVSKETITSLLDIARYAASGGNGQPVEWLVIHDPKEVREIGTLTIEWMKTLWKTDHPMSIYVPSLIARCDAGIDVICRGAPHLLIPHIQEDNPMAYTDGIIALTHFDIAAPAFGVGTCWAGFIAMAGRSYEPLKKLYNLPEGRIPLYALMFGYPKYTPLYIPVRKSLKVTWH